MQSYTLYKHIYILYNIYIYTNWTQLTLEDKQENRQTNRREQCQFCWPNQGRSWQTKQPGLPDLACLNHLWAVREAFLTRCVGFSLAQFSLKSNSLEWPHQNLFNSQSSLPQPPGKRKGIGWEWMLTTTMIYKL